MQETRPVVSPFVYPNGLPLATFPMPVFRAFGLGICIIVLTFLVPDVLSELKRTIIAFLRGAQVSAGVASDVAASAGLIRFSNEPFELPRVPVTRPPHH